MTLPWVRRDRSGGWLFGVCAGLQRTTGISATIFRTSFVLGAYFYTASTLLLFALLVFVMRSRAVASDAGLDLPGHEADPGLSADRALQAEMRELSARLARLEAEALSMERQTLRRFREAGL